MVRKEEEIRDEAVAALAREVALAVRTSPKTRGIDNLSIVVVDGDEKKALAAKMDEINGRCDGKRPTFSRDAKGLIASQAELIVGGKAPPYGLNCGWCGYPDCAEKSGRPGPCVFGCVDMGIGVGVAAAIFGEKRIDNRVMFSMGMAALEMGWLDKDCTMALGLPLSVSGKNIFFDRKA